MNLWGSWLTIIVFLDDDDVESSRKGVVLKILGRRKFLVRYNDCPDKLYSQPLFEKLKVRNFRVTELKGERRSYWCEYLPYASIWHDKTGENIWWNAEVVDLDPDSDPENPKFFVMYDDNGEAEG